MTQRRLAAAVVLAALALRAAPAAAEPPSRTFEDKNFRWTLPSDAWTFEEPPEGDKSVGAVIWARRVVSRGVEVAAHVTVRDAGGSTAETLLSEAREVKEAAYADTASEKTASVRWAGVPAGLLKMTGKADNGSTLAFRVYAAVVDGVMHMLEVRMSNGAEKQAAEEVDALAAGYRLLKGGSPHGGGESPPPEPGTGPGGAPEGGGDEAPAAPAGDGLTKRFEKLGLTWKLPPQSAEAPPPTPPDGDAPPDSDKPPPGPPPRWAWDVSHGNPNLQPLEKGELARAGLVVGEDNPVVVSLFIQPGQAGGTVSGFVNNSGNVDTFTKNNFSDTPIPKMDEDMAIGNWHGGVLILTGKDKQAEPGRLQVRMYVAILKNVVYILEMHLLGGAENKYKPELKAVLAGLRWDDTKEGIRGPVSTPFPPFTEPRGKFLGEDRKVTKPAFQLTKPALFAELEYPGTAQEFAEWSWAAEARKEGAYCFVGILTRPVKAFQEQKPPKDPETWVDDAESQWKNDLLEATTRQKSEKTNRTPGDFGGKKGSAYDFRGTSERTPYLEKGWVVKIGQNVFRVRVQYGGKDAEAKFASEVKALVKSFAPTK